MVSGNGVFGRVGAENLVAGGVGGGMDGEDGGGGPKKLANIIFLEWLIFLTQTFLVKAYGPNFFKSSVLLRTCFKSS